MPGGDAPVVGLNVGLLVHEPDAATWELTCPAQAAGDVLGYRADPSSPPRVLAILHGAVAVSEDLGCSWTQWPLGDVQVLDAGFDGEGRIWVLVAQMEGGEVRLERWERDGPGDRPSSLLPVGYEIGNAMLAGQGADQRFYVTGYDAAAGSAYLFEAGASGGRWHMRGLTDGSFELPRLVYAAADSHALVVRLMAGDSERLALTDDGESFRVSPPLDGFVRGLFHQGPLGLLVALSGAGGDRWLQLDRDGVPSESHPMPFALRQIAGSPERLFALSYALEGAAALLFESTDLGATWSPAVRLADVRGSRTCPAVEGCDVGCLQLVAEGFVAYAACAPEAEVSASAGAGGSARPPAPPSRPAVRSQVAGGCAAAGASAGAADVPAWLGALLALLLFVARRRPSTRATRYT
jgi:hypothetical protein